MKSSRRKFIKRTSLASMSMLTLSDLASNNKSSVHLLKRKYKETDKLVLNYGLIGAGIMGLNNINSALRHSGTKLVAVCDLYKGRRDHVQKEYGSEVFATDDYKEVLKRKDVDVVIIATSDHWHVQIGIDALKAGKHVYCEKPLMHHVREGHKLIQAWKDSDKLFLVGSQGISSPGNEKGRELLEEGAIGELNYAEAIYARNSVAGAWQYPIPADASEETVSWKKYVSNTTDRPFDPLRFFRWRNYLDYGTGMSGDLFVHLFTSLHFVTNSLGPDTISALGGLRHWKDGREVPDVLLGIFNYPETETHPGFNLSLSCNFADGTTPSNILRVVGSEGSMDIGWLSVTLRQNAPAIPSVTESETSRMNLMGQSQPRKKILPPTESVYRVEEDYRGTHYDHHGNLIYAIRTGGSVLQDPIFGFRAAAPALLCNDSYLNKKTIGWDPVQLKLV